MTDSKGLASAPCEHDRSAFDCVIMGIEWRVCLNCGEMLDRYFDGGCGG